MDAAPLPSPVAGARMPPWAKGLLLARVSRVPSAARLVGAGSEGPCEPPGPRSPSPSTYVPAGLKRKRELGEGAGTIPEDPIPPAPVELLGPGASVGGPSLGDVRDSFQKVKAESPSYTLVPGEDSTASDYLGGEDEGGTYLCPAWAIKHPILHLVNTSACQGGDSTGAYWASASPGEGVAMRIVTKPADTAIDLATDDDAGGTPSPGAGSAGVGAGVGRGVDVVGFRPHGDREEAWRLAVPPSPSERRRRLPPGFPMGLRGTARYGFRALRIGEASHPGPPDTGFGYRDRVRCAAAVVARVAHIDDRVAAMRAEYRTFQAGRYGFVGAGTPGDPERAPTPDPPRLARRSRGPSLAGSSSDGAPPASDCGGTSRRTSQTTTSSYFARVRGDVGAGIGEGLDTPPAAYGSSEQGPWSLSPTSPHEGGQADEDLHGHASIDVPEDPDRLVGA